MVAGYAVGGGHVLHMVCDLTIAANNAVFGQTGPKTTGVRSMIFNPDGRTLLCGLHESLKVFSWEPLRCHDAVDVGWSKLADLNIHEGKLLGCSYNQSCVGVWVVDISRVGPYAMGSVPRTNGLTEGKLSSSGHQSVQQLDNNSKINVARISLSHGSEPGMKEMKNTPVTTVDSVPSTPQRAGMSFASKNLPASSAPPSYVLTPKKNIVSRVQPTTSFQALGRSDVVPVIVPRNSVRLETTADSKKEMNNIGRTLPCTVSSKSSDVMKPMTSRDEFDRIDMACQSGSLHLKRAMCNDRTDQNFVSRLDTSSINSTAVAEGNQAGVRCIGASKFRRNTSLESVGSPHDRNATFPWPIPGGFDLISSFVCSTRSVDVVSSFVVLTQARITRKSCEVIRQFWERNDPKGAIEAMGKMGDHAVLVDVISVLIDRSEVFTLEICTVILPLLTLLLGSEIDRHLNVALETLLVLVKSFGHVIRTTMAASPAFGVDLQAEQRLERCNLCYIELEKVKQILVPLVRRGGAVAKSAQELGVALQEV